MQNFVGTYLAADISNFSLWSLCTQSHCYIDKLTIASVS